MATAFKCDVCGTYFDKEERYKQVWRVHLDIDALNVTRRVGDYEPRDLCPKCYAKLEELMHPAFVARYGTREE